jgi:hypothetical protein
MPVRQVAAVHPFRVMPLTPGRPKVPAKDPQPVGVDAVEWSRHLLRGCPDDLQRHDGRVRWVVCL